jgi:hypothetical protein
MLHNLVVGTLAIGATVAVHTFGLMAVTRVMSMIVARFRWHGRRSRMVAMVSVVMGLFAIITAEVWLWAGLYLVLGVVHGLEAAVYFSTVTFSTIGYGDVLPAHGWRLLAALEGVTGFLLIGWSTAYLIAAGIRVGPFRIGEHF